MDIAERMQCPPDFTAAAVIVALGSVIGRRCGIRPKRHDDWAVVPNLWGAVIGRPGVLKSPAIEEALRPLHRLESEAGEAHAARCAPSKANGRCEPSSGARARRAQAAAGWSFKPGPVRASQAAGWPLLAATGRWG